MAVTSPLMWRLAQGAGILNTNAKTALPRVSRGAI
jgi:hypothetical protein